ncbi:MAG TPA: hypothetical protein VNJ04_18475 [Gemmatimonadaceae bacterium]|nr:hypothetical protein [Gemmatimonadaceae bacterium]
MPGHVDSATHGLRSKKYEKKLGAIRAELLDQILADCGGSDHLTTVERITCEGYARVAAQAQFLEARLDEDGLVTTKGARRAAFDMLRGLTDTLTKLRADLPPRAARPLAEAGDYGEMSLDELVAVLDRKLSEEKGQRARIAAANADAAQLTAARQSAVGSAERVTTRPDEPIALAAASPVETARERRCGFCRGLALDCAAVRDEPAWLAAHAERDDVAAHLARQAHLRCQLGWDRGTRCEPIR